MSKAYPCIYCTDDLRCTKYTDDGAISFCVLGPCRDARPSRADQIRYMSDEELAELFEKVGGCGPSFDREYCNNMNGCPRDGLCWLEWLKEEGV